MGRHKGSTNKKEKIAYPRKCVHCEHISNNPPAFHFHNKKHKAIPQNEICHFGCGEKAKFRNTSGKYTCQEKYTKCPAYLEQLSERIRKSWIGANDRKKQATEILNEYAYTEEAKAKSKATLKEKYGDFTPEQMKDFRHYARRIRARSQRWAKDNGHIIGQNTFHVDHKLSVWDAWKAGLSEEVVNNPANLQILPAKENESKGSKSIITVEQLLINIQSLN